MPMDFIRKMPLPIEVKEQMPLDGYHKKIKDEKDAELADIFKGSSDRLILIVGPCSADREDAILDYTLRLAKVQEKVKDRLFLIPRVFTNKPRTMCSGYMGMLYQPDINGKEDILNGILAVRNIHLKVLSETELTTADEMLYPQDQRYISDIISYMTIGARSTENQMHRLTASGLDVPIGFKNPMNGSADVLLNGISAAQQEHTFLYRGWEVKSCGNPFAHAVLRGFTNADGDEIPNYYYSNLEKLNQKYDERNLKNKALIIDTNHANSGKRPEEQPRIVKEVLQYFRYSDSIRSLVKGFMIESYIEGGNQPISGSRYGCSVTDACLGWEDTERLIYYIADSV